MVCCVCPAGVVCCAIPGCVLTLISNKATLAAACISLNLTIRSPTLPSCFFRLTIPHQTKSGWFPSMGRTSPRRNKLLFDSSKTRTTSPKTLKDGLERRNRESQIQTGHRYVSLNHFVPGSFWISDDGNVLSIATDGFLQVPRSPRRTLLDNRIYRFSHARCSCYRCSRHQLAPRRAA